MPAIRPKSKAKAMHKRPVFILRIKPSIIASSKKNKDNRAIGNLQKIYLRVYLRV